MQEVLAIEKNVFCCLNLCVQGGVILFDFLILNSDSDATNHGVLNL